MGLSRFLKLTIVAAVTVGLATPAVPQSGTPGPAKHTVMLDALSARSLYLKLMHNGQPISGATGFVVQDARQNFLVTNWHVLSGRDPDTNQPLAVSGVTPDAITIVHHGLEAGTWLEKTELLLDSAKNPRWLEHPRGRLVDVAILPLAAVDSSVQVYPFDLGLADTNMVAEVAMPVSIIGFPLGLSGPGMLPIWKTGHIASEPELDYKEQPVFLIDATTRGGMSGSPVVLRLSGGFKTRSGNAMMSMSGHSTRFLGVYSGRIGGDTEIGQVWRPTVILEILAQASKAGP